MTSRHQPDGIEVGNFTAQQSLLSHPLLTVTLLACINTVSIIVPAAMPPAVARPRSFLEFPAEIRNAIYTLAVTLDDDRGSSDISSSTSTTLGITIPRQRMEPAITRTNRQIRLESLPMYYHVNTFRSDNIVFAEHWLQHLQPEKKAALTAVHLDDPRHAALSRWKLARLSFLLASIALRARMTRSTVLRMPMDVEGEGTVWVASADLASFEQAWTKTEGQTKADPPMPPKQCPLPPHS